MPALVAGIHAATQARGRKGVDGRDKPGHDGWGRLCHSSRSICAAVSAVMPAPVAGIHAGMNAPG